MYKIIFILIRAALGQKCHFHCIPSSQDWKHVYTIAKEQALLGICFIGVEKLYKLQPDVVKNMPKGLKIQWFSVAIKIQNRNKAINKQCVILQKHLLKNGLGSCILKGQGVTFYYGKELYLLRQPGDIDIWVNGSWKQVMDLISKRTPNKEFDLKHAHYNVFKDTPVEVHWVPSTTSNFFP